MWTIRPATSLDRAGLVALCRAAVGADDYVPDFLDAFLATGVVLVAASADRIVGTMVYHDVPDGSAWLHAARTHPSARRQGVATALMAECEGLARRRRRTSLRLWASVDNTASVSANRKYGFEERARFTRMRIAAGRAGVSPPMEPLRPGAEVWSALDASPILRKSRGYLFHDFYFLPLDRANAARLAREGALLGFRGNAVAVSEDYEEVWGKDLQIQPLFGDIPTILGACPSIAAARGADRVESFLPHDPEILGMARQAGFAPMEWGQQAILFEKLLHGRSVGTRSPDALELE